MKEVDRFQSTCIYWKLSGITGMEVTESQLINLFHKPAASVENPVAVLRKLK